MAKAAKKEKVKLPDPVAFSHAMVEAYQKAAPVMQDFYKNYSHQAATQSIDPMNINKAYMELMARISENPQGYWDLQVDYWKNWAHLWHESTLKFLGEKGHEVIATPQGDKRFKAPEWQDSALFDFIKQSYLLTCQLMQKTIQETKGLDEKDRRKLEFYSGLFASALSPTNFALTNPEVLNETIKTGGENLVRGFENMIEDFKRGHGALKISTTDYEAFKIGKNIAVTPGRVIYQNDLMQLIQYEPVTEQVFKRPLLVIPPWINKYYILDLRPDNSMIAWLVAQGHTVFTISWVNPDTKLSQKRFEDYMNEGILDALTAIEKATGEKDCNIIGYCLGGTLLAITESYLKSKGQSEKIASGTFMTTLLDFEHAGDLKLFIDDDQLELLDRGMAEKGILESRELNRTFSLLRANDLIWSFVVNNYLMGREPFPFDLLYWNDDSTNMPAAMHSFYLRKFYRDNLLAKPGGVRMNETPIDISTIETPAYFLSTREDHIAPWKATYAGAKLFAGQVCFTLAASGHIAGVVNAPERKKYCYWSSCDLPQKPEEWMNTAKEEKGSWWPHWYSWIETYTGGKVPARKPAAGIEAAPGSYVLVKGN
jgi:polyhydroxyalkanoate synthase